MAGFLKGLLVGLASFGAGMVVLSVVLPPQMRVAVDAPLIDTTEPPGAPDPSTAPEGAVADAPEPVAPDTPEAEAVPEGAVAETPEPLAPEAPEAEATPEVAVAETPEPVAPEAPEAEAAPEVAVVETPEPLAPEAPEVEAVPEVAVADAPEPVAPEPGPAPVGGEAEAMPVPEAELAEVPQPQAPQPQTPEPQMPAADEADTAAPAARVLRAVPSVGLDRPVDGVVTGRLPSIGAAPEPATAQTDDAAPETLPALRRHAAAFDASADLPRLAMILIDAPGAEEALIALPFALTIAIDPAEPGAEDRARRYRAAGHEIAILGAGLPARATASDLTVTFGEWLRVLPQAVALIDPPEGGGITGDRLLAQAVMPFLAEQGHGLVTPVLGLNSAAQVAQSRGVPQVSIYRLLDRDDETEPVIRRYLSRAAFEAQSQGQAVALGRAEHAPTLAALIGWRLEMRARQVALAPVSALLLDQVPGSEPD